MGYAILRAQKLKHAQAVRRSTAHALREQDTPNADPDRTQDNTASVGSVSEALERFNERLATQPKVRSNAVLAVEYLVTGSPEDMHGKTRQQQDAYFADALKWLEKRHGKENIVAWGVHRDETTPHMYAVVVPIDERGKLNCRAFLGGAKALTEMQTDFAHQVGQNHGLERGLENSKARHTSIQKYYAAINAKEPRTPSVALPESKLLEGKDAYGERVASAVLAQMKPELAYLRAKASARDLAEQKRREMEATAKAAQTRTKQTAEQLTDMRQMHRSLVQLIAEGGQKLADVQQRFRENLAAQNDRERASKDADKGYSR